MVPSASNRAIRFCTVPRETLKVFANEATGVRASLRRMEMSWRSMSSTGADLPPASAAGFRQYSKVLILAGTMFNAAAFLSRFLTAFWLCFARPWLQRHRFMKERAVSRGQHHMVDFIGIERVRELVDRHGAAHFIE